ncbi:hypothetical protein DAERI_030397 [Deinococcus aerius]|uniref:Glycosyl-4,4'-diaponeurosporenoate acyltransferase n=1 Tax=Deinococcus aerius TaxID=200253 RepID=A0A2I9DK57_9DEIO|nr:hypothetical protein [Deinococcus aerius]GBF05231.1 hypothetical protein DAERI_030397 [Deinococcus aerius]
MHDLAKKLKALSTLSGIRTEVFPGIGISFIITYLYFWLFRHRLPEVLGIENMEPLAASAALALAALLTSVAAWVVSGYVFDPLYDLFYGLGGQWTKKPGRPLGIFYSGYELEFFRKQAREKLARENKNYADQGISIYGFIINRLEFESAERYEKIERKLSTSKALRNTILPTFLLAVWLIYRDSAIYSLILLVISVVLIQQSFELRAKHTLDSYRWFIERRLKSRPSRIKTARPE